MHYERSSDVSLFIRSYGFITFFFYLFIYLIFNKIKLHEEIYFHYNIMKNSVGIIKTSFSKGIFQINFSRNETMK